jgi:formylglycine-generating enzyme required for sulfatase activity
VKIMPLSVEQRKNLGRDGTIVFVDEILLDFIKYLKNERGVALERLGIPPSKLLAWERQIAEHTEQKFKVKLGSLVLLCDALNLRPDRPPRLPCIPLSLGREVALFLEGNFKGWVPGDPPLLDDEELMRWDVEERVANPYQGMAPFRERHAQLFHGRERLVRNWLDALDRRPLLPIIGPSGSGKTSIAQAGILPKLAARGWMILKARPFHNPVDSLAEAVAEQLNGRRFPSDLANAYRQNPARLSSDLRSLVSPGRRVAVFIDQFEELFTICEDHQTADFLRSLFYHLHPEAENQWARDSLRVILTFRSEYIDRVTAVANIPDLLTERIVVISNMNEQEIRDAIAEPARARDVQVELDLIERLVRDVAQDRNSDQRNEEPVSLTNLPLLEFCLTKLWDAESPSRGGKLTLGKYETLGGFRGVIAKHAEEVLENLRDQGLEPTARTIFTQLIAVAHHQTTRDEARRPATMTQLISIPGAGGVEKVEEVVEYLISDRARLLVRYGHKGDGDPMVEIAHDVLIRQWASLRRWIDDEDAFLADRVRVEDVIERGESLTSELLSKGRDWLRTGRGQLLTATVRNFLEKMLREAAEKKIENLIDAMAERVTEAIDGLDNDPWTRRCLEERLSATDGQTGDLHDEKGRPIRRTVLRYRAALLKKMCDETQLNPLCNALLEPEVIPPSIFALLCDTIAPYKQRLIPDLWRELELSRDETHTGRSKRLRAICALAQFDPKSPRWEERVAADVAELLVSEDTPSMSDWLKALAPVGPLLVAPLSHISQDVHRIDRKYFQRKFAGAAIRKLAPDQPKILVDESIGGTKESFLDLLPHFQSYPSNSNSRKIVLEELKAVLKGRDLSSRPEISPDVVDTHRGRAAVALYQLTKDTGPIHRLLPRSQDMGVRTHLIHQFADLEIAPTDLIKMLLDETEDDGERTAFVLALGEYGDQLNQSLPENLLAKLLERLVDWYETNPDPGLHFAIDWAMRQRIGGRERLEAVDCQLTGRIPLEGRNWFINNQGQTFAVIHPPSEGVMLGSLDKPSRLAGNERRHLHQIGHPFAIATKLVTVKQFRRFRPNYKPDLRYVTDSKLANESPVIGVTWYEAARYCQWLNEQEGYDEGEMCYPSEIGREIGDEPSQFKLPDDYLHRIGYRLPTEAEWECACRAGTDTERPFGNGGRMLRYYCWYLKNAKDGVHAVGQLKPNDFGLFDMLGNVWEWCQDQYNSDLATCPEKERTVDRDQKRALRGGAFAHAAANHRSASRESLYPGHDFAFVGFRVARTLRAV